MIGRLAGFPGNRTTRKAHDRQIIAGSSALQAISAVVRGGRSTRKVRPPVCSLVALAHLAGAGP